MVSKKRSADVMPVVGRQESKSSKPNDTFKIITINSNSLANRITDKKSHAHFVDFMRKQTPDVVAIQEVRLPAKAFSSNPKKNDGSRRDRTKIDDRDSKVATEKRILHNCDAFSGYRMYFSLSDWRYAGTMVAVRKGSEEPSWIEYTFGEAEKQSIIHQKLNSEKSLTKQSSNVNVIVESAVARDSLVQGIMPEKNVASVPSSEPTSSANSTTAASIYESSNVIDGHYADGRVICIGLPSFDLLATYAPNNGSTEASFLRRRLWDKDIQLFLSRAAERGRHVVWVGDLNVAHTPADVTHPLFFSQQMRQSEKGDSGQAGTYVFFHYEQSHCFLSTHDLSHYFLSTSIMSYRTIEHRRV